MEPELSGTELHRAQAVAVGGAGGGVHIGGAAAVQARQQRGGLARAPELAVAEGVPGCPVRTSRAIAVPLRMPARFMGVEKMLGSGWPSGVRLPVSRLSPFRQSIQIR